MQMHHSTRRGVAGAMKLKGRNGRDHELAVKSRVEYLEGSTQDKDSGRQFPMREKRWVNGWIEVSLVCT